MNNTLRLSLVATSALLLSLLVSTQPMAQLSIGAASNSALVPVISLLLDEDAQGVVDDQVQVAAGTISTSLNVLNNDNLSPSAQLSSIGGPGSAQAGDNLVDVQFTTGAGGVVTLSASGSLSYDATSLSVSLPNTDTLFYLVQDGANQLTAQVTINLGAAPVAQDGPFAETDSDQDLNVIAASGLLSNDVLGAPDATLISFGGGDLGGTSADNTAGSSVSIAGGTLTVNADGSFSLTGGNFNLGDIDFDYVIANAFGSDEAAARVTVNSPLGLPIARNDSYDATGNVGISVPNGGNDVLLRGTNDTLNGASLVSFGPTTGLETNVGNAGSSAQGGSVTLFANGRFNYLPPVGFTGNDTFVYTLENTAGSDTATVTITVSDRIWFVDNNAASQGNGSLQSPFNSIGGSGFNSASDQNGDTIIVRAGSNYPNGITLKNNQRLLGDGISGSFAAAAGITLPPFSNSLPTPSGSPTTIAASSVAAVRLANQNTVSGFTLRSSSLSQAGIAGNNFASFSGSNISINGGANGIVFQNATGTVQLGANTSIVNTSQNAVNIDSGSANITFGGPITQSSAGTAIRVNGKSGGTVLFNDLITANTVSATAINLSNNGGATVNFNGGLNLDTTTGTGFNAVSGGRINIASSGSFNNVDSTRGRVLILDGVSTQTGMNFNRLTSGNVSGGSISDGLVLNDFSGPGALSVGILTITDPAATRSAATISGTLTAPVTVNDFNIELKEPSVVGLNLSSAQLNANVIANDFDLSSTVQGSTDGINLSSTTGSGLVRLGVTSTSGASSVISNVNRGVVFSALTNLQFTFGDGEEAVDTGSSINASTAIAGVFPGSGTYDFEDVSFPNGTGIVSSLSVFFASSSASGSGNGSSFANAGTITAAENANVDAVIIFDRIQNGSQSVINLGSNTFDLDEDQVLASIINGQTIDLANYGLSASGGPGNNFLFNAGVASGTQITGSGIDSVHPILQGTAISVVDVNNRDAAIVNVQIRSAAASSGNGLRYLGSGLNKSLVLDNVRAESATGIGMNLDPSSQSMEITGSGNQAIATSFARALRMADGSIGTAGLHFSAVSSTGTSSFHAISIDEIQGPGTLTIQNIAARGAGTGGGLVVEESNVDINIVAGQILVSGSGNAVEIGDDAINSSGGNGDISVGASIQTSSATGRAVVITERTGGTLTFSNNLLDNSADGGGIEISGSNSGLISFTGSNNSATTNGAGNNAVAISGGGNVTISLNNFTAVASGASSNGLFVAGAVSGGLVLNNFSGSSSLGIGVNIDPSTNLPVSGSGNQAIGTLSARALRFAGGSVGASGLQFSSITTAGNTSFGGLFVGDVQGPGTLTVQSTNVNSIASGSALIIENTSAPVQINGGLLRATGSGTTVLIGEDGVSGSGGNNSISISATVNTSDGTGKAVQITQRTGGQLSFLGDLVDNSGSGGGVEIFGSNAGSINFSGANNVVTTDGSGNNAVTISGSGSASMTLANFTAAASGTSSNGLFFAGPLTGSLTLNNFTGSAGLGIGMNIDPSTNLPITGANNKAIGTSVARALRLAGGAIGNADLHFSSITTTGNTSFGGMAVSEIQGPGELIVQSVTLNSTSLGSGILIDDTNIDISINGGTITTQGSGSSVEIGDSAISGSGGSGDIAIAASLNTNGSTGRAVKIAERTGGTLLFSGNLIDNSADGGGVEITDANAGVIRFTGSNNVANTNGTGNNAFQFSGSGNVTLSVQNLDATALGTSGNGLFISNSGAGSVTLSNVEGVAGAGIGMNIDSTNNLTIQGSNLIARGTGTSRALRIQDVNIGASNLSFSNITTTGTTSFRAVDINDIDGPGDLRILGGSLNLNATSTTADGIRVRDTSATVEISDVTIEIASTSLASDSFIVTNSGDVGIFDSGVTANSAGITRGIIGDGSGIVVGNTSFKGLTSSTADFTNSNLDGDDNTVSSPSLVCVDGGGNNGQVVFNSGSASCP